MCDKHGLNADHRSHRTTDARITTPSSQLPCFIIIHHTRCQQLFCSALQLPPSAPPPTQSGAAQCGLFTVDHARHQQGHIPRTRGAGLKAEGGSHKSQVDHARHLQGCIPRTWGAGLKAEGGSHRWTTPVIFRAAYRGPGEQG